MSDTLWRFWHNEAQWVLLTLFALPLIFTLASAVYALARRRWLTSILSGLATALMMAGFIAWIAAPRADTFPYPEPEPTLAANLAFLVLSIFAATTAFMGRDRIALASLVGGIAIAGFQFWMPKSIEVAGSIPMMRTMMISEHPDGRTRHFLADDFLYCYPPENALIRVPYGYVTDKTSIPQAAKPIVSLIAALSGGNDGEDTEAAVVHDWLYAIGGTEKDRALADDLFRYAMREEQGVAKFTAWVMHRSVRLGGKGSFGKPREWRFADPVTGRQIVDPARLPRRAGEKPFALRIRSCSDISDYPQIAVCAYRRLHSVRSERPLWPAGVTPPAASLSRVGDVETEHITDKECAQVARTYFRD